MPLAPTDPALGLGGQQGGFGLPTPPTQPASNFGVPGPGGIVPAPGQMPPPPTGYPRPASSYASGGPSAAYYNLLSQQQQRMGSGMSAPGSPPMLGAPGPQKPFGPATTVYGGGAGYNSAYMNLFRSNNGGTIDNYNTLVRPQLQQQALNEQTANDIYGLDRQNRIQQALMQGSLYNGPRSLQGVGTPQYYMNYGRYYPGVGNPGSYYGSQYNSQGYGY
jgi:hypothetical protein